MNDDLVAWLRKQIDEDERLAKLATPGPWSADSTGTVCADADLRPDGVGGEILPPDGPAEVAECYRSERAGERGHNATHIAAHDPTRVLRGVEAKRQIIDEAEHYSPELDCGDNGEWAFDLVLRSLASSYADRPGYREDRVTVDPPIEGSGS